MPLKIAACVAFVASLIHLPLIFAPITFILLLIACAVIDKGEKNQ